MSNNLNFGQAIKLLEGNQKICREGWNGKGMYLFYILPKDPIHRPYIMMKTADNQLVPWVASQSDILAQDWRLYAE